MTRKIMAVAITMAIVTIVALPPMRTLAASMPSGPAFAVVQYAVAEKGGVATVPIYVSNNPGFAAVGLSVAYDPAVLQITGVTAPVADMPLNAQFAMTALPGTQWVSLVNPNGMDWGGDGVVANLIFRVASDAPDGISHIGLSFTGMPDGTPGNANGDVLVNASAVSGGINVMAAYTGPYVPAQTSPTQQAPTQATQSMTNNNLESGQYNYDDINREMATDAEPAAEDAGLEFIGIPANLPNTSETSQEDGNIESIENDAMQTGQSNTATATQGYGTVPQTGVPDILALIAAFCISGIASAMLWVRAMRKKGKGA